MYLKIALRAKTEQHDDRETSVIGGITSAETYECKSVSFRLLDGDELSTASVKWVLDFDTPDPRQVLVYRREDIQTDVYIMNDSGKTIEHYVY